MKKFLLNSFVMVVTVAVAGCGTIGHRVDGDYRFEAGSKKSLVAVSTLLKDKCGRVGGLHPKIFKTGEEGTGTPLPVKNLLITPDYPETGGYFFVYEFDPGQYDIGGVSVGGLTLSSRYSDNFEMLRFDAVPDTVTYIGQVAFTVSKNCEGLSVEVEDRWDRDATVFTKRYANLDPKAVIKRLATPPEGAPGTENKLKGAIKEVTVTLPAYK